MLSDTLTGARLAGEWDAVRDERNFVVGNLSVSSMTARPATGPFRDVVFNMLLARGMSVLEDGLEELRAQGTFASSRRTLKAMMDASRPAVPWLDYDGMDRARNRRNMAIHDRVRLPHGECRDYLAAIERQLVAWGVVAEAKPELWHW
jgi:hypothetical protein